MYICIVPMKGHNLKHSYYKKDQKQVFIIASEFKKFIILQFKSIEYRFLSKLSVYAFS